jgi:hypothetical protein
MWINKSFSPWYMYSDVSGMADVYLESPGVVKYIGDPKVKHLGVVLMVKQNVG